MDVSSYTDPCDAELNELITKLAKERDVTVYGGERLFLGGGFCKDLVLLFIINQSVNQSINRSIPIPTVSKKNIVINRSIGHAELFDQMPSSLTLEENFWLPLLCHGDSLVDQVAVRIDDGSPTPPPLAEYRWYPRTLFKTLLLVSGAILTGIL